MKNYGKAACRTLAFAITACAAMVLLAASQRASHEAPQAPSAARVSAAVVCHASEAAQQAIGRDGSLWQAEDLDRLIKSQPANGSGGEVADVEVASSAARDERTIQFSVDGVFSETAALTVERVNRLAEDYAALCRGRLKAAADRAIREAGEHLEQARSSVTAAEEAMSHALDQLVLARAEHAARVAAANNQIHEPDAPTWPSSHESDQEYAGLAENLRRLRAHRTDLIGKLTAAHPMVVETDHQIEVAVDAISAFAARQTTRAAAHAAEVVRQAEARKSFAAVQTKRQIDNAAAAEAEALAEYQRRRADWQHARAGYDASLARQQMAAEQAGSLAQVDVSVRRASPLSADSPQTAAATRRSSWLPWSACLSLAIAAAVAWGVGVENVETFRSAGDLERSLAIPVLGVLPQRRGGAASSAPRSWAPALCWGVVAGAGGILLIACTSSLAPVAATALNVADEFNRQHAAEAALVVDALSRVVAR